MRGHKYKWLEAAAMMFLQKQMIYINAHYLYVGIHDGLESRKTMQVFTIYFWLFTRSSVYVNE